GTVLGTQTTSSLTLSGIQPSDAGSYAVSVSNNLGGVISDAAVVSIIPQPYSVAAPNTVVSLGGPTMPAALDDVIAIAAGYGQQSVVHRNGTVVAWGSTLNPPNPSPPPTLSNVVAVASGGIHSIALKSDGTVVGWGPNSTPPGGLANVIAISSGHDASAALKS